MSLAFHFPGEAKDRSTNQVETITVVKHLLDRTSLFYRPCRSAASPAGHGSCSAGQPAVFQAGDLQ